LGDRISKILPSTVPEKGIHFSPIGESEVITLINVSVGSKRPTFFVRFILSLATCLKKF
jgi:hypothetical protein